MIKFKILDRNKDCLLLKYAWEERYMVRDIENEVIIITYNYDNARKAFEDYSLARIRKQKRELLEEWIKEFVES